MIEKRKRISIPKTILVISIILFLSPFYNLILQLNAQNLPFRFDSIFKLKVKFYEFFFLFAPVASAFGLIKVKKWGWYFFLFYSILLISFNLFVTFKYSTFLNMYSFFESTIVFIAITYFLQRDISAPYFKLYPRGWRLEKRNPIQVNLKINSLEFQTRDISYKGFYVDWNNCPLEINSEVNIEIKLNEKINFLKAGLVRLDEHGAGFAFRGLKLTDIISIQKIT